MDEWWALERRAFDLESLKHFMGITAVSRGLSNFYNVNGKNKKKDTGIP